MKNAIIITLAALYSLAVAADEPCLSLTSKFPSCVLSCVKKAASSVGCTNTADLQCQCNPKSFTSIQALAVTCAASCSLSDVPAGIAAGRSLCACAASHSATTTSESESKSSGTATSTSKTAESGAHTSEISRTETSSRRTTASGTNAKTTGLITATEPTTTGAATTTPTTSATTTTTSAGAVILQISLAGIAGAILMAAIAM